MWWESRTWRKVKYISWIRRIIGWVMRGRWDMVKKFVNKNWLKENNISRKNISLECKSNKICPLTPICKPRYKHLLDLESNFFQLACNFDAKQREPKALRRLRSDKHWCKIWKCDLFYKKCVWSLFIIWMAQINA